MEDSLILRARICAVLLFCGLFVGFAGTPQHPVFRILAAVLLSVCALCAIWTWWSARQTREGDLWKRVATGGVLLILALGYQLISIARFGAVSYDSLLLFWDLPILLILCGIAAQLSGLLALVAEDSPEAKNTLIPLLYGSLLALAMYAAVPFDPLSSFALMTSVGAGVNAFLLTYVLCFVHDREKAFGMGVRTLLFALVLIGSFVYTLPIFSYPLFFFIASAYLLPSVMVDILWGSRPKVVLGGVTGFLYATFLYAFSSVTFVGTHDPNTALWIALVSTTLGGALGAFCSKLKLLPKQVAE